MKYDGSKDDAAMRILLDIASYAYFRKNEPMPWPESRVIEAIERVWRLTFEEDMDWTHMAGMRMPCKLPEKFKYLEQESEQPRNQCDGCNRGLPINEEGIHYNPDGSYDLICCTAKRYGHDQPKPEQDKTDMDIIAEQCEAIDAWFGLPMCDDIRRALTVRQNKPTEPTSFKDWQDM